MSKSKSKNLKKYKSASSEKAQEEGYYFHLRMQAAAMIASWASAIHPPINGGAVPRMLVGAKRPDKPMRTKLRHQEGAAY